MARNGVFEMGTGAERGSHHRGLGGGLGSPSSVPAKGHGLAGADMERLLMIVLENLFREML